MTLKIRIHKHELGLWFRHGDFKDVLEPGAFYMIGLALGYDRIQVVDTLATRFKHRQLEALVLEAQLRKYLHVVDLDDEQCALLWKDGRLEEILGPGRHAFWKRPAEIEVETFDTKDARIEHDKLEVILRDPRASAFIRAFRVEDHQRALLFVDGEYRETLGPGVHAYWQVEDSAKVTWHSIDLREKSAEVSGQEIMTADKVTLRMNLIVTYRVVDVWKAVSVVEDHQQALYREAQLALRAAVGTRNLEDLLADKASVGAELRQASDRLILAGYILFLDLGRHSAEKLVGHRLRARLGDCHGRLRIFLI